ncbi:MAG TPA: endo-1,4-beta-xylanase [Candidatus Marinimicrobia bacterium]|nr:endo-1,4-beta-xylanase [Candidatus Neomarinimicrobiota bacterium]
MPNKTLIFKPYFIQKGRGPHLDEFAYLMDMNGDTFHSDVAVKNQGVTISNTKGIKKFTLNVRWNVEGYGYLFMPADNGGEFYSLPQFGSLHLNLNFELAKTRIYRNRRRQANFNREGWLASRELSAMINLAENYLDDAIKNVQDDETCARFSQQALLYALWASELLELEKARWNIAKNSARLDFLFGCDGRGYFQMDSELFLERFTEIFNYATITHYLIGDFVDFEPVEGQRQFAERDRLLADLEKYKIQVAGRPLFWTHKWVTPDWLKNKTFPQLLNYLEKHIRTVVGHYGNRIKVWEVVNELHDWANELFLNHEQTIELTKFACDIVRDVNPNLKILINNCSPFGEYVQKGLWHELPARYPQRTPFQFTEQIIEAGTDFDAIGVQVYFTSKTLADYIGVIERYEKLGKAIHLAEVGAPSRGITQEFLDEEPGDYSTLPYEWHRHWDEELQADWLEAIFTYAYSQPMIQAANWYDLIDGFSFLKNGGLLRSPKGERKAAVDRLKKLQEKWRILQ